MVPLPKSSNPLASFMRQPKIFIRLPSNGEFWPQDSLDKTENGEYPVYSMTAKDELMLKVPDALMNGQAVVSVIEHCVPNIKNAWHVPNIDIDVILIAIRIATYGDNMTVPVTVENKDFDYTLNLTLLKDQLMQKISWETAVPVNSDLTIHVKPINYKQMTESALKTFETQKLIDTAQKEDVPQEVKLKAFNESFERLNEIAVGIVNNSVFAIETSQGATDNPKHIKEFMENSDKAVFDAIRKHIDVIRDNNMIKPIDVDTTPEMKEAGITAEKISVPLVFDASTFFV